MCIGHCQHASTYPRTARVYVYVCIRASTYNIHTTCTDIAAQREAFVQGYRGSRWDKTGTGREGGWGGGRTILVPDIVMTSQMKIESHKHSRQHKWWRWAGWLPTQATPVNLSNYWRGSGVHLFIYIHIYNRISSIKSTCTHFPLCTARELYEEHLRNSEYTGNPCQDGT